MHERTNLRGTRWDLLLPAATVLVSALLIGTAGLASYAFNQREALALDGRVLGVAHRIETVLRSTDSPADGELPEILALEIEPPIVGLILRGRDGKILAAAGQPGPDAPSRTVTVYSGPQQGGRGRPSFSGPHPTSGPARGRRGLKTLDIALEPDAGSPPLPIRLLLPASISVGIVLVALAVLGGRLLIRQRRDAEAAAERNRLEALGRAGAGLAHQLRNPLATVKGSAQLLEEQSEPGPVLDRIRSIIDQSTRMDRMLAALLDFARPPAPEIRRVDLESAIDRLTRTAGPIAAEVSPGTTVRVDPDHLDHILENLLSNAIAHSPSETAVEVETVVRGNRVVIRVHDRGPGPGDDPEELFQPYVSHRPDGTGLGLTIARTLAQSNGGSLDLSARPGGGTTATLILASGGH